MGGGRGWGAPLQSRVAPALSAALGRPRARCLPVRGSPDLPDIRSSRAPGFCRSSPITPRTLAGPAGPGLWLGALPGRKSAGEGAVLARGRAPSPDRTGHPHLHVRLFPKAVRVPVAYAARFKPGLLWSVCKQPGRPTHLDPGGACVPLISASSSPGRPNVTSTPCCPPHVLGLPRESPAPPARDPCSLQQPRKLDPSPRLAAPPGFVRSPSPWAVRRLLPGRPPLAPRPSRC